MSYKEKSPKKTYVIRKGNRKAFTPEEIKEFNEMFWEKNLGLDDIAKEKRTSTTALGRVITITRKEWETMK